LFSGSKIVIKSILIKSIAEEVVNRLFTEQESLLDLGLKAVIEALRMNPDRYKIIYNSKYDSNEGVFDNTMSTTAGAAISSSSPYTSSTSIMSYQNRYYNKYHEGLLELAKGFFKSLLSQIVNKTMVAAIKRG
jgi:hypothetical protein